MSLEIKTIPVITVEQMAQIEQLMFEEFGIHRNVMMEKAGIQLAELSHRRLNYKPFRKKVAVVVGNEKYRTCGIVAARCLSKLESQVTILAVNSEASICLENKQEFLQDPNIDYKEVANSWQTFHKDTYDLILDLLLGYDIWDECPSEFANIIDEMNRSDTPIISMDIPSGLDGETGVNSDHCIRAAATLTLALPKVGLLVPEASPFVGNLFLADISIPPSLYQMLGISCTPIFQNNGIIPLSENSIAEHTRLFFTHQISAHGCLLLEKG